ncbi:hypothetical protein FBEOM_13914 [Fusarium beomiforme]|uniref:Uncharacterized protein n=1 Tax=Fusarium beomiforme TaxID=44412 RepID=A0A9P5A5U6_9HYPO|nr:hypothetical protein FBEOM_13914 [Fusarium beomiforme]
MAAVISTDTQHQAEDLSKFNEANPESLSAQLHAIEPSDGKFKKMVEGHALKLRTEMQPLSLDASSKSLFQGTVSNLIAKWQEVCDAAKEKTKSLEEQRATWDTCQKQWEDNDAKGKLF